MASNWLCLHVRFGLQTQRIGATLKAIGRVFDRNSSSIFSLLSPTEGIRHSPRRCSKSALTLREREEIS
jgi:hypothetical protein